MHRNHPVQVVSEAYLNRADPEGAWDSFDSAAGVLATAPVPEPDDEEDAHEVSRREPERRR